MAQPVITEEAVRRGAMPGIEMWERNSGIIAMRRVLRETQPNTSGRMHGAQLAFPPIKALWKKMRKAMPSDAKKVMDNLFHRVNTDRSYAILAYNTFPVIADRYGVGIQINGQPRLSLLVMSRDPLCRALI